MTIKKCAYYVRVSTQKQKNEKTIKSQVMEIEKRIKEDENILLDTCRFGDNGWSGAIIARPGLDHMRQAAKRREFDVLYVYDRGRLARNFVYQEVIIEELKELGIKFVTLTDVEAKNPIQEIMQKMQGVFHEYERVKTAERMRLGKISKTKNGKLLGYNPAYGFNFTPKNKDTNGYFTINKIEANNIKTIFDLFVNKHLSIRQIVKELSSLKIYPRKRKRKYWSRSVIVRLLRNKTYIGKHYYNKTEAVIPLSPIKKDKYKRNKKSSRKQRPRKDWIIYEQIPQIIDENIFNKAQVILDNNKKFANRNKKHDYLLNGLVYCTCGHTRAGQPGGHQHYYRCTERIYNYPVKPKCKAKSVNAEMLDGIVWKKIKAVFSNPRALKRYIDKYIKNNGNENKNDFNQATELTNELKGLKKEETRYLKLYGKEIISAESLELQLKANKQNQDVLLKQIYEINNKKDTRELNISYNMDKIYKVVTDHFHKLNFKDKKVFIREIINKVTVNQEFALVNGHLPRIEHQNVTYKTIYRNSRSTKCRQINTF